MASTIFVCEIISHFGFSQMLNMPRIVKPYHLKMVWHWLWCSRTSNWLEFTTYFIGALSILQYGVRLHHTLENFRLTTLQHSDGLHIWGFYSRLSFFRSSFLFVFQNIKYIKSSISMAMVFFRPLSKVAHILSVSGSLSHSLSHFMWIQLKFMTLLLL